MAMSLSIWSSTEGVYSPLYNGNNIAVCKILALDGKT